MLLKTVGKIARSFDMDVDNLKLISSGGYHYTIHAISDGQKTILIELVDSPEKIIGKVTKFSGFDSQKKIDLLTYLLENRII